VPIIVSQKTAEKYLGIENSEGANDYEDVKKNIIGKEYEACYRNNASKQLLFNVEQSKNNELSGIVYENPTIACGPVSIKSDKRSTIEKQYDDRNIAYQKALNEYEEPKQKKIVFKVIGVIPTGNEQDDNTTSLFGLIKDLGKIDISTPLIPKSYYMANQQALSELFNDYSKIKDIYGVSSGYLVEFNDAYTTERFVNEQSCKDSSKGCLDKSAPFYLTYDNKSLILADISSITKTIVLIVAIATVALAIATTIIIILRSISSEKKEISIYKAIGFRRTHLVQVYFTQTLIVSVVTIILATIIAISIGWLANAMFSNILAHELTSIFSIYNQTIKTNIFTVNIWPSIEVIALFISSTAIASIVTTTLSSNNNIVSGLRYE
jgi:ABC-type antimicrobial peptide transport system permease subunit